MSQNGPKWPIWFGPEGQNWPWFDPEHWTKNLNSGPYLWPLGPKILTSLDPQIFDLWAPKWQNWPLSPLPTSVWPPSGPILPSSQLPFTRPSSHLADPPQASPTQKWPKITQNRSKMAKIDLKRWNLSQILAPNDPPVQIPIKIPIEPSFWEVPDPWSKFFGFWAGSQNVPKRPQNGQIRPLRPKFDPGPQMPTPPDQISTPDPNFDPDPQILTPEDPQNSQIRPEPSQPRSLTHPQTKPDLPLSCHLQGFRHLTRPWWTPPDPKWPKSPKIAQPNGQIDPSSDETSVKFFDLQNCPPVQILTSDQNLLHRATFERSGDTAEFFRFWAGVKMTQNGQNDQNLTPTSVPWPLPGPYQILSCSLPGLSAIVQTSQDPWTDPNAIQSAQNSPKFDQNDLKIRETDFVNFGSLNETVSDLVGPKLP